MFNNENQKTEKGQKKLAVIRIIFKIGVCKNESNNTEHAWGQPDCVPEHCGITGINLPCNFLKKMYQQRESKAVQNDTEYTTQPGLCCKMKNS